MKQLAELRERRALTLRELSEMSGVAADTINQVELGRRKARPSTLRKLTSALDVSLEELYSHEESHEWPGDRDRLIDIIDRIADEAKRRVMDPKNLAKGDDWREMEWADLYTLSDDEEMEFSAAVEYGDGDPIWEAGDKLVVDAMRVDKAGGLKGEEVVGE